MSSAESSAHAADGALIARVAALEALAQAVQADFDLSVAPEPVARVAAALRARGDLPGAALVRVPPDYYARPLAARAALLGAPAAALCKTLVFENRSAPRAAPGAPPPRALHDARHVAVVLQYAARLDAAALARALATPGAAPADVALAADGEAVTGFARGGVAPVGAAAAVPVILARDAAAAARALWVGGGAPDVKLRLFAAPFARAAGVVVRDISVPRGSDDGGD